MNCRRVSSLLSAYLDAELTGSEMLEIRAHLDGCPACRAEHRTLRETKHLLASLALQTPRQDFEPLLRAQVERASHPAGRWVPSWLLAWQGGALSLPRPRPLVAAAALSLTTLLLATATLDTPSAAPDASARAAAPEVYPRYVEPHSVYLSSMPLAQPAPLVWNEGGGSVMLSSYNRGFQRGFQNK